MKMNVKFGFVFSLFMHYIVDPLNFIQGIKRNNTMYTEVMIKKNPKLF